MVRWYEDQQAAQEERFWEAAGPGGGKFFFIPGKQVYHSVVQICCSRRQVPTPSTLFALLRKTQSQCIRHTGGCSLGRVRERERKVRSLQPRFGRDLQLTLHLRHGTKLSGVVLFPPSLSCRKKLKLQIRKAHAGRIY